MHLEVKSEKSGRCPQCDMELIPSGWRKYQPLFTVIGLIILASLALTYRDLVVENLDNWDFKNPIIYFMTGFFLTFAGFKLLDLKGFVEGYITYDFLAMRFRPYAYLYPFIELFFGLSMLASWRMILVLKLEILVMTFSGLGVLWKLLKREKFQCVCLGTVLKVPLTYVILIEDFGMATLAVLLLFFYDNY